MKPYRSFLTLGTLAVSLGMTAPAEAENDIALSFDLAPTTQDEQETGTAVAPPEAIPPEAVAVPLPNEPPADAPLPIPPGAENPPLARDNARPAGVYGGLDAIAIGTSPSVQALLPPPPPVPEPSPETVSVAAAIAPAEEPESSPETQPQQQLTESDISDRVGLAFWQPPNESQPDSSDSAPLVANEPDAVDSTAEASPATNHFDIIQALFDGGTDSLVARAVGSAEGTRTPEGHKNPAYFGHVDPGNGVWNMGTFSYQHGAQTPEEADAKQLARLKTQTQMLKEKARAKGIELSQEELLNGIDLANQAPLAALDRGGYIDWLKEAHKLGMQGSEAVIWARTRSFIDPDTQRWNAPGLGNNIYSISHDQERRANAIARAISVTTPAPSLSAVATHTPQPASEDAPAPAEKPSAVAQVTNKPRNNFLNFEFPSFRQRKRDNTTVASANPPVSPTASQPSTSRQTSTVDDAPLDDAADADETAAVWGETVAAEVPQPAREGATAATSFVESDAEKSSSAEQPPEPLDFDASTAARTPEQAPAQPPSNGIAQEAGDLVGTREEESAVADPKTDLAEVAGDRPNPPNPDNLITPAAATANAEVESEIAVEADESVQQDAALVPQTDLSQSPTDAASSEMEVESVDAPFSEPRVFAPAGASTEDLILPTEELEGEDQIATDSSPKKAPPWEEGASELTRKTLESLDNLQKQIRQGSFRPTSPLDQTH